MARKNNDQSLGDVIQDLLKVYRLESKMEEYDVRAAWEAVMGKVIAEKTSRIALYKGTLTLSIESGVMKEEFSYNKTRIIELLNEYLGKEVVTKVEIW